MSAGPAPIAPFQLRFVPSQPRYHANEATNDAHPWLVICNSSVLDAQLFLGPLATHAGKRRDNAKLNSFYEKNTVVTRDGRPYLVPVPLGGKGNNQHRRMIWVTTCIDYQDVWTFTFRHDDTDGSPPRLTSPSATNVRERLKNRFRKHEQPTPALVADAQWRVGRLCMVRLDAESHDVVDGRTRLGNLATLTQVLPSWSAKQLEVPCLIVASDQEERERGKDPWRVVTVTPLVHPDPSLSPKTPRVTIPGRGGGTERYLVVLTSLLFTVGYDQNLRSTRVRPGCREFGKEYVVPDHELDAVLRHIHRVVG